MGKRINLVVFIDGTGNNDFKNPAAKRTNVARLWHACENMSSDEVEQQVYYKPGVGTRLWELVRGNAMGAYLKDRVYELLSTLNNEISIARQNNVEAHVYMFGFSRGAYAVRWLATLLDHDIDVLGVWDTVKATLVGPDVDVLPDKVKHAFHAIAIPHDEIALAQFPQCIVHNPNGKVHICPPWLGHNFEGEFGGLEGRKSASR